MMGRRVACFALLLLSCPLVSRSEPLTQSGVMTAKKGMVVCCSPPAAQVGLEILKRGGNAVDAAIAVAFAEAVTYPIAGNIGGGGFMLIHPAPGRGQPTLIDYRETAPAAATADLFAKGRDSFAPKIVGVPGTVRGMQLAFEKYGSHKLSWMELVSPAVQLAENGFALEAWSARSLSDLLSRSPKHKELLRVFARPGGGAWQPGEILKQPDLAQSLRLIAGTGPDAFYSGPIADLIVAEMQSTGGLISKADLAGYQAKERAPIHGTYRGFDVYAPPPPSSGGIALIEMLNILEQFDIKSLGVDSTPARHLMIEAMRRAFIDRYRHVGDPDFVSVPDQLTTKEYAKSLAAKIDRTKATASLALAADFHIAAESNETTHFSVVDADGMAVSNTYTLEESYGSRIVVRGAGFILNNEMNDFNPVPGVTKVNGQIGTAANLIAPGKRMLSSQTPTILAKNGKVSLVTGSPGGRTITNTVLNVVVNVVDHGMDVQAAVDAPRLHQQAFPDEVKLERARDRSTLADGLKQLGHKVISARKQGDAHSIWIDPTTGLRHAGIDRRIMGQAAGY